MKTHKLTIDNKEVFFVNYVCETESGPMQETELYIDGWQVMEARCNCINRPWDRYSYQTSMINAARKLQEEEAANMAYLANNSELSFYKRIVEALR